MRTRQEGTRISADLSVITGNLYVLALGKAADYLGVREVGRDLESFRKQHRGFTLVEIMIVVLIIGILLALAVPNFVSARQKSRASAVVQNLRQISTAKDQLIMANALPSGAAVNDATDLVPFYMPQWPSGPVTPGTYLANPVNTNPTFMGQDESWYTQHCTGVTADSSCPL